jgi:DNA-3-methyladenine glycosylase I
MNRNLLRCPWCLDQFDQYIRYHDEEWGVPVHEDQKHYEFLVLEGAQAGLSWSTILKRREAYRKAFLRFDPVKVARFNDLKIKELLNNSGIIRNKLKIISAVNNAKCFLRVKDEYGSFDHFIWQYVQGKPKMNHWKNIKEIKPTTPESDQLSKDLKQRGFTFVGSTIIYAHMQAIGMVNDHLITCFRHKELGG